MARLREEAEQQLKRYHQDENLARRLGSTTLIKLVLIFSATDLEYIGEVP